MATELRRFTVSVTQQLDTDLNKIKKELYYNSTHSEMIRDLISLGLETLKSKEKQKSSNSIQVIQKGL